MTEQEQLALGSYCHELMADERFNQLITLTEASLSLQMLESKDAEEREKVHSIYKGMTYLLDTMQQFVINKDQIVVNNERDAE